MNNTLIIDTTRELLTVAVIYNDKLHYETVRGGNNKHMSLLFVKIDELLKQVSADISMIDTFAAVVGPGSYTGIRIGVCAINAMAKACGGKLISINSLEPLSHGGEDGVYLIDNGHDYYALEIKDGQKEYSVMPKEEAASHKNAEYREHDISYIDGIEGAVRRKTEREEYVDMLVPFYMKKAKVDR